MRIPGAKGFYQAHASNYSKGRGGQPIRYFTVHHMAYIADSLRNLWQDPNRNASSHLGAFQGYFEQYVDTDDTAWTNGNFTSNQQSITCETRGDWRFGFYDQATLNGLTEAMYQTLKKYPNLQLTYHMDISQTACPADLKHKGYAKACWDKAKNRIKVEAINDKPKVPVSLRVDIPDKKVILIRDANLWDMSFTSFAGAKAVAALPKGTVIDVAGKYDHPLSKVDYYLSNYSWNKGLNNGISIADCKDYVAPKPTPKPTPPPVVIPPKDENAGTLPPIPVDPEGNEVYPSWFTKFISELIDWLKSRINKKG